MDIKHVFSINPLLPAYQAPQPQMRAVGDAARRGSTLPAGWSRSDIPASAFAFDNERPRHKVWLEPFRLAARPVTCGEYLDFIEAGGYQHAGVLAVGRLGDGSPSRAGRRRSTGTAKTANGRYSPCPAAAG